MSRPHPRRHLGIAPSTPATTRLHVPDELPDELPPPPVAAAPFVPSPDLLAGAVRAELLADDWRSAMLAVRPDADPEFEEDEAPDELAERLQRSNLDAEQAAAVRAHLTHPIAETVTAADEVTHLTPALARAVLGGEEFAREHLHSWSDAPPSAGDGVGSGGDEWAEVEAASDADFDHDAPTPDPEPDPAPPTELVVGGGGRVLDWRSKHDPRSLAHLVRAKLAHPVPVQDRVWPHGPILDQGTTPPLSPRDASGCTGFATVAALNALNLHTYVQRAMFGRDDALDLYLGAQRRDHVPGEAYAGSSVLAAMAEAKHRGWIDGYLWCRGTRDVAQAVLQVAPVVLGIPWLSAMSVDGDAVLRVVGERGGVGHAIACIGIVRNRAGRPGPFFVLQQSAGPEVGDGGLLYVHHTDLALLLRGVGEAAVPVVPS